jgi:hypothetical protein
MMRTVTTLALLLLLARPGATEPPFSRARWLAEHEHEGRFDDGALPLQRDDVAALVAARAATAQSAPAKPGHGPRITSVRVSTDVMAGDSAPDAQPLTEAEPYFAIDPTNERRLLAGFQEERFASGGARVLTAGLSTDGGRTWANTPLPALTVAVGGTYERASDPWVAFGPEHRAYFVSLLFNETSPENGVYVSSSNDGGATWGDPVAVHVPPGTDFDDKEAITVDNAAASPYRGRVYVAWDSSGDVGPQPLMLSWSGDGGQSFSPAVTLADGVNIGAVPLVGPDGVVHVVWAQIADGGRGDTGLYTASSADGGVTWSEPALVSAVDAAGVRGMRVGDGLPAATVDARTGALYVAWEDSRFTGNVDQILLTRSLDGGATWSDPVLVSDGPDNRAAFTPAVAVDGSGRVGVSYYSLRNDTGNFGVDEYLAFSRDGGNSFAASTRVSGTTWSAASAAISRGFFLGDYQGLVAGASQFHPLYVATFRQVGGRAQPDVFTAAVR